MRKPVEIRAQMYAHEIEANLREGYAHEKMTDSAKGKKGANTRDAMWAQWGIGK